MNWNSAMTRHHGLIMGRRQVLLGAAALGAAAAGGLRPTPARAAGTLKVGTYGGYFKDSFDQHIYPAFTEETGIEIESIAEPTGEAWLVQLQTAARAGQAPADVSMMAQVARLKGQNAGLWAKLDEAKLPNLKNLHEHFVHRYPDGAVSGVGAVSWYVTLCTNTEEFPEAPTSWKALWDEENAGLLGLMALQHRGQESAGVAVLQGDEIRVAVGMGRVDQVFRVYNRPPDGGVWKLESTYDRGSDGAPLPQTLQVGPIAYTYTNSPDLVGEFDYVRFRPVAAVADCTTD